MSAIALFSKFAGKNVVVEESGRQLYVPRADETDLVADVIENLHPKGRLEPGFTVVGVDGLFEDGEAVQTDGFLAVNEQTNRAYLCDEGTITPIDTPASALTVEEEDDGGE